jgi:hypothetical protein
MTHTLRHARASGCNLGVVRESRNRLCLYATDVAKYTLPVSFTEIFDQISQKRGRPQRPILEGVHSTDVAPLP